jgi:hypothetical protein
MQTPFATQSRRADGLLWLLPLLLLAYSLTGCAATTSLAGHDAPAEHATPTRLTAVK